MPYDEKWAYIAHETGVPRAYIIALWSVLLSKASQNEQRGNIGDINCRVTDVFLQVEGGTTERVLKHMKEVGCIDDENYVVEWEKYQGIDKEKHRMAQAKYRAKQAEKTRSENAPMCDKSDNHINHGDTSDNHINHGDRSDCKIRQDKIRQDNNNIYTTATDVVVEKGGVGENKTDASASYCGDYCGGDEEREPRLELRADNPSPSKGKVLTLTMPLSRKVVEIPIKRSHVPYEDMQRLYNTVVAAENGAGNSPTRCLRLDDKRRKVLAKAWNETPYMPWFEEYARMVRDSCPFLMGKEAGRNGRFFKLDIAQFFRSDIITKALEGKYRTRYDGALTLEQVFDIWNEKLAPRGFDRAVILGTETERRDKLRIILDEFDNTVAAVGGAEKFFRALCDVVTTDPWCCGENKQQRKITVNFFLESRSVARLIQTSLS